MVKIEKFEDIIAWQKALKLSTVVYKMTNKEKFSKDYELKNQIRRASVSGAFNIAEGFERESNNQFIYFLIIAKGSAGELRSQIYIAKDQEYITKEEFETLNTTVIEVSNTIGGFSAYLRTQKTKPILSKLS